MRGLWWARWQDVKKRQEAVENEFNVREALQVDQHVRPPQTERLLLAASMTPSIAKDAVAAAAAAELQLMARGAVSWKLLSCVENPNLVETRRT